MCIAKNYKYIPHPLLTSFPSLYEIKCVRTPTSQFTELHNKICNKCYEVRKPLDYESGILHGFLDGNLTPYKCNICKNEIVEMRSILQCDDCFRSYVQFTVDFRKCNSNDIALLLYDVKSHKIIYLLFIMRKLNPLLKLQNLNFRNYKILNNITTKSRKIEMKTWKEECESGDWLEKAYENECGACQVTSVKP